MYYESKIRLTMIHMFSIFHFFPYSHLTDGGFWGNILLKGSFKCVIEVIGNDIIIFICMSEKSSAGPAWWFFGWKKKILLFYLLFSFVSVIYLYVWANISTQSTYCMFKMTFSQHSLLIFFLVLFCLFQQNVYQQVFIIFVL